jgi:hypothetical protein
MIASGAVNTVFHKSLQVIIKCALTKQISESIKWINGGSDFANARQIVRRGDRAGCRVLPEQGCPIASSRNRIGEILVARRLDCTFSTHTDPPKELRMFATFTRNIQLQHMRFCCECVLALTAVRQRGHSQKQADHDAVFSSVAYCFPRLPN